MFCFSTATITLLVIITSATIIHGNTNHDPQPSTSNQNPILETAYASTRAQLEQQNEENQRLAAEKEKLEMELRNAQEKLSQTDQQDDRNIKVSNCKKYTEAYKVAECASGLLRDGLIDKAEYQHFLFDSMRKAKSEETSYYSCGVEWGDERSFICGRQDIYEFDSTYAKIPLRLPYLGKMEKILHRSKGSKPRLLYSFSDIDAPEFSTDTWRIHRPASVGRLNHLWKTEGFKKLSALPVENCAGVSNKIIKAFEDWSEGTILAPSDLWCPDKLHTKLHSKFEIIIGSYSKKAITIKGSKIDTYVAEWEFSYNDRKSYGPIPSSLFY